MCMIINRVHMTGNEFATEASKTAVWLPNLYVHFSIVTHVTNTTSKYRPTSLGCDVELCTIILILISGAWAGNKNSFQKITQWVIFWLGAVSEILGSIHIHIQLYTYNCVYMSHTVTWHLPV